MDKLKTITFVFSTPRGLLWQPLSWLIRFVDAPKSLFPFKFFNFYKASHVAIYIDGHIIESVFFLGTRKISFKDWLDKNRIRSRKTFYVTPDIYRDVEMYLDGSLGIPYSYWELVGIFLDKCSQLFFKKPFIGNPFTTVRRKAKCSETAYNVAKIMNVVSGLQSPDLVSVRGLDIIL